MSEERTIEHINTDYTKAIARLGEIDFLVEKSFPHERDELYKKVRNLQNEAEHLQSKLRQAAAKKEVIEKAEEPQND